MESPSFNICRGKTKMGFQYKSVMTHQAPELGPQMSYIVGTSKEDPFHQLLCRNTLSCFMLFFCSCVSNAII